MLTNLSAFKTNICSCTIEITPSLDVRFPWCVNTSAQNPRLIALSFCLSNTNLRLVFPDPDTRSMNTFLASFNAVSSEESLKRLLPFKHQDFSALPTVFFSLKSFVNNDSKIFWGSVVLMDFVASNISCWLTATCGKERDEELCGLVDYELIHWQQYKFPGTCLFEKTLVDQ